MNAPRFLLLEALASATAEAPLARRLLVVPRMAVGRELLRALTLSGVDWVGWDVATPVRLAGDIVAGSLSVDGLTLADAYEAAALLDRAVDAALAGADGNLAALLDAPGLRRAIAKSVYALRVGGVDAALLEQAQLRDDDKRTQVAQILAGYETLLADSARVDAAALLQRAVRMIRDGAPLPADAIWIVPGQDARGLPGQLLHILLDRGARVLAADPVVGMSAPRSVLRAPPASAVSPLSFLHQPASGMAGDDVVARPALFKAASVTAELREVLRRVVAMGAAWDEVEIVAADAVEYGVALDGLARQLDVPVTWATGLPVARTMPGRAVLRLLEWLERGMPADVLRRLLESGDVDCGDDVSGAGVARCLRGLRVGAGRVRYVPAMERRLAEIEASGEDEAAAARERAELRALREVFDALTAPLPTGDATAPADVAAAMLALLARLRVRSAVDALVREQLGEVLRRIRESGTRATTRGGAIAQVVGHVEHALAPGAGASSSSTGGALHFADLAAGGWTGRRVTFVVGLDAGRFPGTGGADALLVDDDRERLNDLLGTRGLALATERIAERRYALAALLARLRGDVIVSWPVWQPLEGRGLTPAAELLQVYRLATRNAIADYDALNDAVSPAATAVPRAGGTLLDSDDAWLHALSDGGALRRGILTVCAAYPALGSGARAWRDRKGSRGDEPGPVHGAIAPRASLDPRVNPDVSVSASSLQTLGACPHRYLLRHVLRVRPAEEPVAEDGWLTPLQRGRLLHAVYERSLRALRDEGLSPTGGGWDAAVERVLEEEIARTREYAPPHGEGVYHTEVSALRADVAGFVAMVREDGGNWLDLEHRFGGGPLPPLRVQLPGGDSVGVEGVIDRVDRLDDGRLVVIDYKTGSRARFGSDNGVWDDGRRLQHALYSLIAEQVWDAEVARAEYVFPGRRTQNHRAVFDREALRDGPLLMERLLDFVRNGWFVPTNTEEDCRACDFAVACRVRQLPWNKVDSPLATFMREAGGPAADAMRGLRR